MHRRLRHAHPLVAGRDAGMEVGQGFAVIEPIGFGHEALDQREDPVGAVDKAGERGPPIGTLFLRAAFVQPGLGAGRVISRWKPQQSQEIPALEMRPFFLELRPALGIDETRCGVRETTFRIAVGRFALRLDEDRPARAETPQGVVEPCRSGDQLRRRRRVEVRSAKPGGALERAVLVEHDALFDEGRPGQEVGEAVRPAAVFGKVHHPRPHVARCCG